MNDKELNELTTNDKPTIIDEENMTEEERQKLVLDTATKILKKYSKAFEELAKL